MAKRSKKDYNAQQKFQIVLECLTSDKEDAEIARAYGVHPTSLSKWKRRFLESGAALLHEKAEGCSVSLASAIR